MKKNTRKSNNGEGSSVRAAIYVRVSTTEQVEGYSLSAQERACRAYVEAQGWSVTAVYAEEGVSGTRANRPQLKKLEGDIAGGKLDVVVVHKLDRLARNLRVQIEFVEGLGQSEVDFVSVTENLDLTTPMGWAAFQMQGVFAEHYSRNLAFETKKGLSEKARAGGWVGPVPLGYEKDDGGNLVPSKDAEAVRQIFEMYASGSYSYTDIADHLNANAWRTLDWRTGERRLFGRESVRTILKNRAYFGYVKSGGTEYVGNHKPLLDERLWEATRNIRGTRTQKGGKTVTQRGGSMISGLLFCASCGGAMWYHYSGPRVYFRCKGISNRVCNARMVPARAIEKQVLEMVGTLSLPEEWQREILLRAARLVAKTRHSSPISHGFQQTSYSQYPLPCLAANDF